MATDETNTSNAESTPPSQLTEDFGPSVTTARHVLKPAIIATFVTYISMPVITAGVHLGIGSWKGFGTTVMIGYSGAIFGWLAGFMASPYDTNEQKRLTRVASWISLLTSGYIIGKLEPSMSEVFDDGQLIKVPLYGVRLLNFLINLTCTGITVYLYRLYGEGSPSREAHSESDQQELSSSHAPANNGIHPTA
jgi:hypothetical protein